MILDESELGSFVSYSIRYMGLSTHLESSDHPPPTRTITVCERKIRQKQSFGS